MTETVPETAPIAPFSAIPEQNIRFSIDMARLRDAWRAVSGLSDDGSFTLVVSSREVRLQASDQLSVEGIVPISEISGFNTGTALHLNLAENSLAALGFGELPRSGYVILDNLIAEEGFLGVMKLETDFVVQWPYTVTAIGIDAITVEPIAGTPVDPRTMRSAISEIRDFAGKETNGYNFGTLQVIGEEALGMSLAACNSIKTDRFKAINLRFPASCAKVLGVLLGQLQPADTKLTTTETHHILSDGRIRVTLPIATPLPEWPEPKLPVTEIQIDAADFKEAVGIIAEQKAAKKDVSVSLVLAENSDTLTLSVAVPGGEAVVSCPVAARTSEAIDVPLSSQALAMFQSPLSDVLQLTISKYYVQIEQISESESRKMLVSVLRPQNSFA